MSKRIVQRAEVGAASVAVYFDCALDEYCCKLTVSGVTKPEADYFTDDREDAIKTAWAMARHASLGIRFLVL